MNACVECGDPAETTGRDYTGPCHYVTVALCTTCAEKRDNYEPPDPDGEDLFRDYDAEQRDQMDAARRLK